MTVLAPATQSEASTDPRDPLARLAKLFDAGTVAPLHDRDKSGVLAASGEIDGVRTIAYCSDATVMGGAMGVDGCKHIVAAIDTAIAEVAGPTLPPLPIDLSMLDKLAEGVDSAVTVGTTVGTLVGALAGCLIGGTPLALTGIGLPASVLSCLGGAATAAPVGGIIGTIVAAGPVLAYNGWQVYQTMNTPAPAAG
ncbi:hypothetical protein GS860_05360 [Rhodococcus hoagii]|nr:hypothetical protein [Prescottella equi]